MSGLDRFSELEKYIFDPFFSVRFGDAAARRATEIAREPYKEGIKIVSEREVLVSAYDFFEQNKTEMEENYLERLLIRLDEEKVYKFITIMTTHWVDGFRNRNKSCEIWEIKNSIKYYLVSKSTSKRFTVKDECQNIPALFNVEDIEYLLYVTQQMFDNYLEGYLHSRSDFLESSTNRIYIHRGLSLDCLLSEGDHYEYDYINSYSLTQTVPEQFTTIASKLKAMVGGCVYDFHERILAFAPFIPGMKVNQMELCIIPALKPMNLRYNGVYSDIHEYTLTNKSSLGSFADLIEDLAQTTSQQGCERYLIMRT